VKYSLHPLAKEDLREAAKHYRQRAGSMLAQALLADFEHEIQLLLLHPKLGALWAHGKRRLSMRHFPYAIVYAVVDDEIQVLAVAHHSRHPNYWRKRKQQP
jgi:toxin ParE1/3/4